MEAAFYEKLEDGAVVCHLCSHECLLLPGERGICKCRVNENGTLIAKTYGEVSGLTTENLKEMGFHFYQDKKLHLLSMSGYGCNMNCPYCINKHISQSRIYTESLPIGELLGRLENLKASPASVKGVCYTFNEPLIWYEHVRDYAQALHEGGYINAIETNGMINPEAFRSLLPLLDLVNIDYKGFDEEFYKDYLHGDFQNVLENIKILAESGVYYEVTCVIVANVNDNDAAFEKGMQILQKIAPKAPLNLLAMVPADKSEADMVPSVEKMADLLDIAEKYFEQVKIVERES